VASRWSRRIRRLFAGDSLLPLLTTLSHANAEQALALIGVQTPKPGSTEPAFSEAAPGEDPAPPTS
jgi:hypothetical protein